MSTADIRELALQLPPDERVVLAHDLLASVEPEASSQVPDVAALRIVDQVAAITGQLFQSPVTVKESYDPEFPAEKYIVFIAEAAEDHAAILNLENQWNRQVTQLFPGWHGFRLSVRRKK